MTFTPQTFHLDAWKVVCTVCDVFSVDHVEVLGRSRARHHSEARATCYLLLREVCRLSTIEVGEAFDREHTTVVTCCRNLKARMRRDRQLRGFVEIARARVASVTSKAA